MTLTLHKIQVHSYGVNAVISLRFTHVPSFTCRGGLRNLWADCSTVGLYCVTIVWQKICKGSLHVTVAGTLLGITVAGVLLHCWTQTSQVMQRDVSADSGNQVHLYCAKKSMSESRGATSSSFRGGAIFMKFHSMTSSCLFNCGTTFSQTVTDIVLFATFPKIRTFQF